MSENPSAAAGPVAPTGAASATGAATVLAELDSIEYKFAVIDDARVGDVLPKLLPSVLSQLGPAPGGAAPSAEVRAKVMKILSHVSTRLKSLPGVQLPMTELLALLHRDLGALGVKICNIYVQMGAQRMTPAMSDEMFPQLLRVASFPAGARHVVLSLLLKAMPHVQLPAPAQVHASASEPSPGSDVPSPSADGHGVLGDALDKVTQPSPGCSAKFPAFYVDRSSHALVHEFFLNVLLLQKPMKPRTTAAPAKASAEAAAAAPAEAAAAPALPAGLSLAGAAAALGLEAGSGLDAVNAALLSINSDVLYAQKREILRFLSAGFFPALDALPLLIAAASDLHHEVKEKGEDEYRRILAHIAGSDKALSHVLPLLVPSAGVPAEPTGSRALTVPDVRAKALECLLRINAAHAPALVLQIFFANALNSAGTTPRLQQLCLQLIARTVPLAAPAVLAPLAPLFKHGLIKLLADLTTAAPLSPSGGGATGSSGDPLPHLYGAISVLSQRAPAAFANDIETVKLLFRRLPQESEDARLALVEALSGLATAFSTPSASGTDASQRLHEVLDGLIEAPDGRVRKLVAHWETVCFTFDDAVARVACMRLLGDERSDVRMAARAGLVPAAERARTARGQVAAGTSDAPAEEELQEVHDGSARDIAAGEVLPPEHPSLAAILHALTSGPADSVRALRDGSRGWRLVDAAPLAYAAAMEFAADCMECDAQRLNLSTAAHLSAACDTEAGRGQLIQYMELLEMSFSADASRTGSEQLFEVSARMLHVLADHASSLVAARYAKRLRWLLGLTPSSRTVVRRHFAAILGKAAAVAASADPGCLADILPALLATAGAGDGTRSVSLSDQAAQEGALIALGYLVAALPPDAAPTLKDAIKPALSCIIAALSSPIRSVSQTAAVALRVASRALSLPLPGAAVEHMPSLITTVVDGDFTARARALAAAVPYLTSTQEGVVLQLFQAAMGARRVGVGAAAAGELDDDLARSAAATDTNEAPVDDQRLSEVEAAAACMGALAGSAMRRAVADGVAAPPPVEDADGAAAALSRIPHMVSFPLACLFSLGINRFEQVHFAVGSAIVEAISGKVTPVAWPVTSVLRDDVRFDWYAEAGAATACHGALPDALAQVALNVILERTLRSVRPQERAAGAIWLLTITKSLGRSSSVVHSKLASIQSAFMALLGDKNQFTQECAGRGLAVVYQCSDETTRQGLVRDMLGTFESGKRKNVSAGGGLLASSAGPDVHITDPAFKELCNMATDAGRPDLLYQFLAVSAHHALWNSRGGASLGLEALLRTRAKRDIEPHLGRIIPRLLRYTYDPNPRVKENMTRLWQTLVSDDQPVITRNFNAIMTELLSASQGDRDYREKEAACLALNDVIQGRDFAEIGPFLEQLWRTLLRAIDDVKDSVRSAGLMALSSLGKLTLRLVDAGVSSRSTGQRTAEIIVPFLVHDGLNHPIKDAQLYCIGFLRDVAKVSGAFLRPFIPELVFTVTSLLSSFEDSKLSYIQTHANAGSSMLGGEIDPAKVEALRIQAARQGPLGEILDFCLREVRLMPLVELDPSAAAADVAAVPGGTAAASASTATPKESLLQQICDKLQQLIRSGVGLPTRAVAARTVSSLVLERGDALKPYAVHLMRALQATFEDSSPTLRKECAAAAARLAVVCKTGTLEKLVLRIAELANKDDRDSRTIAAEAVRQLAKSAAERIKAHFGVLVPMTLLGIFDNDPAVNATWTEAWDVLAPSPEAVCRLYLKEIMERITSAVDDSAWVNKRQGAAAAVGVVEILSGTRVASSGLPDLGAPPAAATDPDWERAFTDRRAAESARPLALHLTRLAPRPCPELLPHAEPLLQKLTSSIGGRLWDGKHQLLRATASIASACPQLLADKPTFLRPDTGSETSISGGLFSRIVNLLLVAGRKGSADIAYAMEAWRALTIVSRAVTIADASSVVVPAALELLRGSHEREGAADPGVSAFAPATTATESRGASISGGRHNEAAESEARAASKALDEKRALTQAAACCAAACSLRDSLASSGITEKGVDSAAIASDSRHNVLAWLTATDALQGTFTWSPAQARDQSRCRADLCSALLQAPARLAFWQSRAMVYRALGVVCAGFGEEFAASSEHTEIVAATDARANLTMHTLLALADAAVAEDKYLLARMEALCAIKTLIQRASLLLSAQSPWLSSARDRLEAMLAAGTREAWAPMALGEIRNALHVLSRATRHP